PFEPYDIIIAVELDEGTLERYATIVRGRVAEELAVVIEPHGDETPLSRGTLRLAENRPHSVEFRASYLERGMDDERRKPGRVLFEHSMEGVLERGQVRAFVSRFSEKLHFSIHTAGICEYGVRNVLVDGARFSTMMGLTNSDDEAAFGARLYLPRRGAELREHSQSDVGDGPFERDGIPQEVERNDLAR